MPLFERKLDHTDPYHLSDLALIEEAPQTTPEAAREAIWELSPLNNVLEWVQESFFDDTPADPDFDYDFSKLDVRYRPIYGELVDTDSRAEFDSVINRYDESIKHHQAISNASIGYQAAYWTEQIFDPITLPLFFMPWMKGMQMGSVMARALKGASVAGADIGLRELGEHYQDPSRTAQDSAQSMFLAASIGAAAGMIGRRFLSQAEQKELQKVVDEVEKQARMTGESVGAAAKYPSKPTVKGESPLPGGKHIRKLMLKTPILRSAYSTLVGLAAPAARIAELVSTGITKVKHAAGISDRFNISLDDLVSSMRNVSRAELNVGLKLARKQLRARGVTKDGQTGKRITLNQLAAATERAVVYGDDVLEYTELLAMVKEIRKFRRNQFNRGVKVGLFKDGEWVKFNKHYGPRFYDRRLLREQPQVFQAAVVRGYRAGGDTRPLKELEQRAQDSHLQARTLSTNNTPEISYGGMGPISGHTKKITLEVDDEFIEGFLIRDVRRSQDSLIQHLEAEIVIRERYGQDALQMGVNGRLTIKPIQDEYISEFRKLRSRRLATAKAHPEKTEAINKQLDKTQKVHEESLKDLEHVVQKILGFGEYDGVISAGLARFLNETRAWTSAAWMGNSMIASLSEPMKQAMEQGFGRFFKSVRAVSIPKNLTEAQKQHLRAFGVGNEMGSQGTAAMVRAEVDDPGIVGGLGTIGSKYVAPWIYQLNGQNVFNTIFKRSAAVGHQDQVLRFAMGTQKEVVGSPEYRTAIARFAQVGIDKSMLSRIGAMAKKEGGVDDMKGVLFAASDKWADKVAATHLNESLVQIANSTIIHPRVGHVPRIIDNQVGRMILQFKNILFNMQGQLLIPTAQKLAMGDMRAARGVAAYMGVAWMQVQLRMMLAANFDMDKYENEFNRMSPGDHMREMLDRGGLFPFLLQGVGIADVYTEGRVSGLVHLNESARTYYRNASTIGNVIPAFSYLEKIVGALASPLTESGFQQSDANALGYTMPMRTLFWADPMLDAMQSGIVKRLPEGDRRKRRYARETIKFK